jgi:hypothetical protein
MQQIESKFAETIKKMVGVNVAVTNRGANDWTISSIGEGAAQAAEWLQSHGLMTVTSSETYEEDGETEFYFYAVAK